MTSDGIGDIKSKPLPGFPGHDPAASSPFFSHDGFAATQSDTAIDVMSTMEFIDLTEAQTAEAPFPCGWKILIQEPSAKNKRGSILLTDETKDHIQNSNYIGRVLKLGPLAYKDPGKFGRDAEPWCKVGDVVTFKRYAGQVLQYRDVYMRLLNDNEIHSVVPNHNLVSIL